jgi:hypothetical protein
MKTCETNWEDTENNRRVDLTVTYVAVGDTLELKQITPTRVTFLCPDSRQPLRSIGVHRDKARALLIRKLHERSCVEQIEGQLRSLGAGVA